MFSVFLINNHKFFKLNHLFNINNNIIIIIIVIIIIIIIIDNNDYLLLEYPLIPSIDLWGVGFTSQDDYSFQPR